MRGTDHFQQKEAKVAKKWDGWDEYDLDHGAGVVQIILPSSAMERFFSGIPQSPPPWRPLSSSLIELRGCGWQSVY